MKDTKYKILAYFDNQSYRKLFNEINSDYAENLQILLHNLSLFSYDYDTADEARFLMENLSFLGAHELKRISDSKITITEENAICFRVIKDSYENLEKEDWSVQNGILMRNGYQAAEQGEMEIKKILAVFP